MQKNIRGWHACKLVNFQQFAFGFYDFFLNFLRFYLDYFKLKLLLRQITTKKTEDYVLDIRTSIIS